MMDMHGDEIALRGMQFHAYHGVMPEEAVTGNRFVVHVRLFLHLKDAGLSDDVTQTVNYADVYKTVQEVIEGPRKQLIEAVAEAIANTLLARFAKIQALEVELEKPHAPIAGVFDTVSVKIQRAR